MRIAIVNDSAVVREALRLFVAGESNLELAWTARHGREAVERCQGDRPDLILMDILMPVMDGVAATREIMAKSPCGILLVTSSVDGNASKVFEAMGLGALDAIDTPMLSMTAGSQQAETLRAKIATISRLLGKSARRAAPTGPAPVARLERVPLVAIGSSTGGPKALAAILAALPADFPAGIVIAQHIDKGFAEGLASWLQSQTAVTVQVAKEGAIPRAGLVLLAGTNDHFVMRAGGSLGYTVEPAEYPFRPSVDELFKSLAQFWSDAAVAVILTGMSRDGAEGMLALRKRGWHTIAQDEATSVIYSMPQAAAQLGAAVEILPVGLIGPALITHVKTHRPRPSA